LTATIPADEPPHSSRSETPAAWDLKGDVEGDLSALSCLRGRQEKLNKSLLGVVFLTPGKVRNKIVPGIIDAAEKVRLIQEAEKKIPLREGFSHFERRLLRRDDFLIVDHLLCRIGKRLIGLLNLLELLVVLGGHIRMVALNSFTVSLLDLRRVGIRLDLEQSVIVSLLLFHLEPPLKIPGKPRWK
jgi:hypothetical protein